MTKPKTKKLKYAFGTKKFLGDIHFGEGQIFEFETEKECDEAMQTKNFGIGTDFTVCMMCDEETKNKQEIYSQNQR